MLGDESHVPDAVRYARERGAPAEVTEALMPKLEIPVIGIGAGPDCDAQVLVWQDMAGLRAGRLPRFVKTYADLRGELGKAARTFAEEVAAGDYPGAEHSYE